MKHLPALLVLFCVPAMASDTRVLTGDEIVALLPTITATTDTTRQTFAADGGTVFANASRTSKGRWRVHGDHYCSTWLPSNTWRCYAVEVEKAGNRDPDRIIWIDVELGDRTVNDILPRAQ